MKKSVIITGANGSLGLWMTKYLIDKGFHVIMACRDIRKAKMDVVRFKEINDSSTYTLLELNLSDFQSISNFVTNLNNEELFGLVCNAGMSYEGPIRYSKQGIEETFCSNYLGHYLLTQLIISNLKIQNILFISSALHDPDIKSPFPSAVFKSVKEMAYPDAEKLTEKSFSEFYATAKLCEILFAYELNRRLNITNQNININVFNPGFMPLTNFGRTKNNLREKLFRWFLHTIGRIIGFGTTAMISGNFASEILTDYELSGKYFDRNQPIKSSKDSYDDEKAKILWEGSYDLVKDYLYESKASA